MAAEEPSESLPAEPDEATSHDGEGESGADASDPVAPAPDDAAPTARDVVASAAEALIELGAVLDAEQPDTEHADVLLDRAHLAIVALLDGPKCPMCQGDGLLAVEPPNDPRAERCEDCNGVGQVYTGSLVPESAVRPCGKCGGKGFNDVANVTPLTPPAYVVPPAPTGAQWYDADDPGTWHLPIDPAKRGQHVGT